MEQFIATYNKYFLIILVWELLWKGIALWKAARKDQRNWYVAMLVLNTIGILPIIYIKFFQKRAEIKEE